MADEPEAAEEFEVDFLRARRIKGKGTVEYLVKWAGRYSADSFDSWEPMENLRGTSDFALEEYNRTHPDVDGFRILEQPDQVSVKVKVTDRLASAIGTFYEDPSLPNYTAIQNAGMDAAEPNEEAEVQQLLYDDARTWLKQSADSIDMRSRRYAIKTPDHRSDMTYYAVLVEVRATSAVLSCLHLPRAFHSQ